ncbi:MAG: hypothetical protein AAFY78_21730 [Cyanobacteria bacterium J06648_16]
MARRSTSDRIKFVYNAQFPAPTAVLLDYLLNNEAFTARQGRQLAMDAISAFYRPAAAEFSEEMSEEQVRDVASHCVEQLMKRIEELCDRYHLDSPLDDKSDTTGISGDRLENILDVGFQKIADAISTGNMISGNGQLKAQKRTVEQQDFDDLDLVGPATEQPFV